MKICELVNSGAWGGQKGAQGPIDLELQVVVIHPRVLGTELQFCTKVVLWWLEQECSPKAYMFECLVLS